MINKMKTMAVIPYIYKPYFDEFMETWKTLPEHELMFADNTEDNLGVAKSWNLGIDWMKKRAADWFIIISAAIRFGRSGVEDMYEQLEAHPKADMIHFASKGTPEQPYVRGEHVEGNLGWHLTAINRRVIDKVGEFDTNFFPAYFEDIDYDIRVRKAFDNPTWLILPVDAICESNGHGVELGRVKVPVNELIAYFATKWGRHPNATQLGEYERPFNE